MRFQLISDVHVECPMGLALKALPDIPALTPTLVMAGDIGNPLNPTYQTFVYEMGSKFERVLLVAGNHEYYRNRWGRADEMIREVVASAPRHNITLLDKTSLLLDGVRIVGTTLWSHVPPEAAALVAQSLNDYYMIRAEEEGKRLITVQDTNDRHAQDVAWLEHELREAKAHNEKVVVVTHHAPLVSGVSDPRYNGDPITSGFSTDLRHLMGDPIKVWCFGHTHFSCDLEAKGTRVVSNQLGYVMSHDEKFRPDLVIDV